MTIRKNMKQILNLILLLSPVLITCQNLPIDALKRKGITQEEIDNTISLNGKNGVNNYFLISRQTNKSQNPNIKIYTNYFNLYTPTAEMITLTQNKNRQTDLIYFEFQNEEIVLIEKIKGLRKQIRISKYDLITNRLKVIINAEIPCRLENNCEWIKIKEKKLAFFTNAETNEELEHSSIYEFNWQTNEIKLVFGKLPPAIDATTGRNLELIDVKYNQERNEFEYGQ